MEDVKVTADVISSKPPYKEWYNPFTAVPFEWEDIVDLKCVNFRQFSSFPLQHNSARYFYRETNIKKNLIKLEK